MSATRDYNGEAEAIAARLGLRVKITKGAGKCPKWGSDKTIGANACHRCGSVHGQDYKITLSFTGKVTGHPARGSCAFDFWGSQHDQERGKDPSTYDVLACVSSDMSGPTDPDEVVEEFGSMKPSQAIASANFAKRLQAFFTEEERETLSEVS